jgi:hypothetical protein
MHGFGQVDDADTVTGTVNVFLHLGVPAAGLVAEMATGFHKIVNCDFTHLALPFCVAADSFDLFSSPPGCLVINLFSRSNLLQSEL